MWKRLEHSSPRTGFSLPLWLWLDFQSISDGWRMLCHCQMTPPVRQPSAAGIAKSQTTWSSKNGGTFLWHSSLLHHQGAWAEKLLSEPCLELNPDISNNVVPILISEGSGSIWTSVWTGKNLMFTSAYAVRSFSRRKCRYPTMGVALQAQHGQHFD